MNLIDMALTTTRVGPQIRSELGATNQANGRANKGKIRSDTASTDEKIALLAKMKERSLTEFEEFLEGTMRQFTGEKLALKS